MRLTGAAPEDQAVLYSQTTAARLTGSPTTLTVTGWSLS
jgi:hypothetical protein